MGVGGELSWWGWRRILEEGQCKGRRCHVYTFSFISYYAVLFQLYLGWHHMSDAGPVYITVKVALYRVRTYSTKQSLTSIYDQKTTKYNVIPVIDWVQDIYTWENVTWLMLTIYKWGVRISMKCAPYTPPKASQKLAQNVSPVPDSLLTVQFGYPKK